MLYDSVQDVLSRVQDVTEFLGVQLDDVNQTGIFGNTPLAVRANRDDGQCPLPTQCRH
jgi:hypothetical protein